jgi:hypothetical protein
MPERWLSVPHYQQSDEATCLAACARMVLYRGIHGCLDGNGFLGGRYHLLA